MLKITLASGQEQDVPFNATSTVTVTNQGFVDGVATPVTASFSEIVGLEIVADEEPQVATIQTEDPPAPPVPTGSVPVDQSSQGPEPTSFPVTDPSTGAVVPGASATIPGVTMSTSGAAVGPDGQPADVTTLGTSNAFATPGNTSAGNDAQNPVVTQATPASGLDAVVTTDPEPDVSSVDVSAVGPVVPGTSNPQVDEQAATPGAPTVDTTVPVVDTVGGALAQADAAGTTVTEPTDGTPAQDGTDGQTPPTPLATVVANAGAVVDAAVNDPAAHIDHLAQAQTDVSAALATWPDDANLLDLKQQLDDLAADASEATSSTEPPAAA